MTFVLTAGHRHEAPQTPTLLEHGAVKRPGRGRPRLRPDTIIGDKGYTGQPVRAYLRRRGIRAVIPEPADQAGHRTRRGSRGGRPVTHDPVAYRGRNVIERAIAVLKQWRE